MTLKDAIHELRDTSDTQKRAQYARQFWDVATRAGEPGATTTFHEQHDKNDYYWDAVHNMQRGDRGNALGYLTQMRFTRWLGTESGRRVTGVDCSGAGRNGEREQRVRQIVMQFFGLAVRLSKRCEIRRGDVEAVARCRSLNVGSFCLFPGFTEALLSHELRELSDAWRAAEAAEATSAPVPTPLPPTPRLPTPTSPAPRLPTQPPAAPQVPSAADLHSLAASALVAALQDFGEAERLAPSMSFGATGCRTYAQTSLYEVRVKRVSRTRSGRSAGPPFECCVLLRGVLKRGRRTTVLRTAKEIKDAFSRKNFC
jgi:hypothetical protein